MGLIALAGSTTLVVFAVRFLRKALTPGVSSADRDMTTDAPILDAAGTAILSLAQLHAIPTPR